MSIPVAIFTPADKETADVADGPAIIAWLEREGHMENVSSRVPSNTVRRLYEWRRGTHPDFYMVDRVLNEFDVLLSDLPESVWFRKTWGTR